MVIARLFHLNISCNDDDVTSNRLGTWFRFYRGLEKTAQKLNKDKSIPIPITTVVNAEEGHERVLRMVFTDHDLFMTIQDASFGDSFGKCTQNIDFDSIAESSLEFCELLCGLVERRCDLQDTPELQNEYRFWGKRIGEILKEEHKFGFTSGSDVNEYKITKADAYKNMFGEPYNSSRPMEVPVVHPTDDFLRIK